MGNKIQFLKFYEEYKDKIFNYFWYRVGFEMSTAEDLTSDVFLKALKNFDSFDSSRSFQSWIYAIARNHLSDYYQKAGRETKLELIEEIPAGNPAEILSQLDDQAEAACIIKAIRQLNDYHREVLLLRFVDGLSNTEITAIIGKEEGAVRVQISRALKELRKILSVNKCSENAYGDIRKKTGRAAKGKARPESRSRYPGPAGSYDSA